MKKNEKSWIDEEREREYQNQITLNGEPYDPEDQEKTRYRVTNEEEANYEKARLKRLALTALAAMIIAIPLSRFTMQQVENYRVAQEQKQEEQRIEEKHIIGSVKVGDVRLEIATPDMKITDDGITYVAPEGFTYDGYNCYRLSCEGEAPEGYVKGEDNTLYPVDSEIKYQAPEKFILIGDKAVEVIDAEAREVNGETMYFVPNGYTLVGKLGFKMIKAIPLEDEYGNRINIEEETSPITTTIYTAPAGYTLSGTKCIRKEYCDPTAATVDGKTTYTLPAGYSLEYINGEPKGVKTLTCNATAKTTYSAPEGYILIGNKCYKIEEPTVEETKGR